MSVIPAIACGGSPDGGHTRCPATLLLPHAALVPGLTPAPDALRAEAAAQGWTYTEGGDVDLCPICTHSSAARGYTQDMAEALTDWMKALAGLVGAASLMEGMSRCLPSS